MAAPPPLPDPPAAGLPARASADPVDLDTRIRLAEQRLVARDLRLRTQMQDLGQRVSGAVAPRALLLKLGGLAVAGGGLAWAWRRGRHGAGATGNHAGMAQVGGPQRLLLSLLPMAWPLLPACWRRRVSPATAATVVGVAVPLVRRLLARRAAARRQRHASGRPAGWAP